MSDVDLLPGWRRALRTFEEQSLKPADFVSDEWLEAELGIVWPKQGSLADFKKMQLRRLGEFDRFASELLERQQIALRRSTERPGYDVLTAAEQVRYALAEGASRVKKGLRWTARLLTNVDTLALTDKERADHADALAKLSRLRSMATREISALPKPLAAPIPKD